MPRAITWRNMPGPSFAGVLAASNMAGRNMAEGVANVGKAFDDYGDDRIQKDTDSAVNALRAAAPEDRVGMLQEFADGGISLDSKQIGFAADKLDAEDLAQSRYDEGVRQFGILEKGRKESRAQTQTNADRIAKRLQAGQDQTIQQDKLSNLFKLEAIAGDEYGGEAKAKVLQGQIQTMMGAGQKSGNKNNSVMVGSGPEAISPQTDQKYNPEVLRKALAFKGNSGKKDIDLTNQTEAFFGQHVSDDNSYLVNVDNIMSNTTGTAQKYLLQEYANKVRANGTDTKDFQVAQREDAIQGIREFALSKNATMASVNAMIKDKVKSGNLNSDAVQAKLQPVIRDIFNKEFTGENLVNSAQEKIGDLTSSINSMSKDGVFYQLDSDGKPVQDESGNFIEIPFDQAITDQINAADKIYSDRVNSYNDAVKSFNLSDETMAQTDKRVGDGAGLAQLRDMIVQTKKDLQTKLVAGAGDIKDQIKLGEKLVTQYDKTYNTQSTRKAFGKNSKTALKLVKELMDLGYDKAIAHKAVQDGSYVNTRFMDELTGLDGTEGMDTLPGITTMADSIIESLPAAYQDQVGRTGLEKKGEPVVKKVETSQDATRALNTFEKALFANATASEYTAMREKFPEASDEVIAAAVAGKGNPSEAIGKMLSEPKRLAAKTTGFFKNVMSKSARLRKEAEEEFYKNMALEDK